MNALKQDIEKVSQWSRYFKRSIANPAILENLEKAAYDPLTVTEVEKIISSDFQEEQLFLNNLRTSRNQLLNKLIFQDLLGIIDYQNVVEIISHFANEAITAVFNFYKKEFLDIHHHFYIIAMGKLGGGELNVSSDIDLIFAHDYPTNDDSEYKTQVLNFAKKIIFALNHNNENGFVFRVDTRLRPHGSEGVQVPSLNFLEDYYLNYGREWERYAWIKQRVIIGNQKKIDTIIRPFVYRKYLDYKTIAEIRNLKKLIKKDLNDKNKGNDIKLGYGGIREIEFIIQALQLIRGGKNIHLRGNNSLDVLQQIYVEGLLPQKEYRLLKDTYIFFRNVEHRIQYQDDKQTHLIPNGDDLKILADSFSMEAEGFLSKLNNCQQQINFLFEGFFNQDKQEDQKTYLYKNENNKTIVDNLCQSKRWQKLPAISQNRILYLFEVLDAEIEAEGYDDQIFIKVYDLIETIASRSNYIAFFFEYIECFKTIIEFASKSTWIIDYIKKHPILIDDVLINEGMFQVDYDQLYARTLDSLSMTDQLDEQLDLLRDLKHKLVFQLAISEIRGVITLEKVSDELTAIADFFIYLTLNFLKTKFKNTEFFESFVVIAYGKFGAKEMSYASDLDIVFLYDHDAYEKTEFINIAKKLSTWLSSYTNAGILYELDLALRPNGNNGLLVSSFDAFAKYQHEQAWAWEHQALSKARFCYGNKRLALKFEQIRSKVLIKNRSASELKAEIYQMRLKMYENSEQISQGHFDIKNSKGGLIDIEFFVQYFILLYAKKYPSLIENKGNLALIDDLASLKLIKKTEADSLSKAYRMYRNMIHQFSLNSLTTFTTTDSDIIKMADQIHLYFQKYLGNS